MRVRNLEQTKSLLKMTRGLCRKRRLLIPSAYIAAIGLLIVSGLGCFSCVTNSEVSAANWVPTTASEFKSYITPECPFVQEALQDMLGAPPYEPSKGGFDNIRDWVAIHVDYMSDENRWGTDDYWQTAEETLSMGTGDCEDFSVLLCSLFRAYGIDAEQVYLVIGVDGSESAHAFLMENWYLDGEWRAIESQASTQSSSLYLSFRSSTSHPDSRLDKYEITAACNDLYYYNKSFPWD